MALSKPVTQATIDEEEEASSKPKKTGKGKAPAKLVPNKIAAAGSNSGVIPGMVEIVEEILSIDEKIKELGKAKRDLRNKAKSDFGVLSFNLNEEIRFRKLDPDVRKQYESGRVDIQAMLGYQASLDLRVGTTPRTEEEYVDPSAKLREGDKLLTRG